MGRGRHTGSTARSTGCEAPAVARQLERVGVRERVGRGAEAVGVEEQLRAELELPPQVRQRVAQEDDVRVCEEEGRVELLAVGTTTRRPEAAASRQQLMGRRAGVRRRARAF